VIAACAVHIPLKKIPAHVVVIRHGQRLHNPPRKAKHGTPGTTAPAGTTTGTTTTPTPTTPPPPPSLYLKAGDQIQVAAPAVFTFSYEDNRYRIPHATFSLECTKVRVGPKASSAETGVLAVRLKSGRVNVLVGTHTRRALVLSPEMLAFATVPGTHFVVERNPRAGLTRSWTFDQTVIAASASNQLLRINTRASYTALSNRQRLHLNVWPFSLSPLQRPTTAADGLPPYWADGLPCSVGCAPAGLVPGWPLAPFHQQHAIRAGINELRPANFHVGVDIQANNYEFVYAISSGIASIRYPGTGDSQVDVGPFDYWHIHPTVSDGQYVTAYKTVIGQVLHGFGHIALSQGPTSDYLNPLRPGGGLLPYTDTEPPVIGVPEVFGDGRVIVHAFDPQSFIHKQSYLTPVLAPSSLAWRLYDAKGHALTGLEWAMRGSQNYPPGLKPVIFAPGASNPGFACFYTKVICIPNWVYNLAGGLTGPLPFGSLRPGRYRLTVYAWDWKGNTSALDYWFKFPLANAASASWEFGPLATKFDYP
jgi:hypothetical protein